MARPSLSSSRKTTAKAVADKIAGKKTTKSTTTVADKIPVTSSPIVSSSSNSAGFSTVVPGLVGITPDAVAGMMPQFQENTYAITGLRQISSPNKAKSCFVS